MGFYGKNEEDYMGLIANQMAINFIASIIQWVKINYAVKKNKK